MARVNRPCNCIAEVADDSTIVWIAFVSFSVARMCTPLAGAGCSGASNDDDGDGRRRRRRRGDEGLLKALLPGIDQAAAACYTRGCFPLHKNVSVLGSQCFSLPFLPTKDLVYFFFYLKGRISASTDRDLLAGRAKIANNISGILGILV